MSQTNTQYGWRTRVNVPYEQAVEKVTEALQAEGFGVLTEIDVQATLKKKLDAEFRKYVILGACNPSLAYQALNTELEVGLLLPCNVIVYAENDASIVSIVDPIALLGVVKTPGLDAVADEAHTRLQRVIEAV